MPNIAPRIAFKAYDYPGYHAWVGAHRILPSGDTMLVNGKIFPYLEVEPRKYRFRVLNAANARLFDISLSDGQSFHQIGTDLGLLPLPLQIDSVLLVS